MGNLLEELESRRAHLTLEATSSCVDVQLNLLGSAVHHDQAASPATIYQNALPCAETKLVPDEGAASEAGVADTEDVVPAHNNQEGDEKTDASGHWVRFFNKSLG